MNWAAFVRQTVLTIAFLCGVDLMAISFASGRSVPGSVPVGDVCGIEVVSPHLCPRQSNTTMPCCYEMIKEKKIRRFKSKTSYQEETLARLKAEILHGNVSEGEGGVKEKPILIEDSISGRSVVCLAAGFHLCYYRLVTTKNLTKVSCSSVTAKALHTDEDSCFHYPVCKTDVCSKTNNNKRGLIISRPAFYICLTLTFIFMNTAIWAGLRKCGGKDPEPGRL